MGGAIISFTFSAASQCLFLLSDSQKTVVQRSGCFTSCALNMEVMLYTEETEYHGKQQQVFHDNEADIIRQTAFLRIIQIQQSTAGIQYSKQL